jgi:hypothetical protein
MEVFWDWARPQRADIARQAAIRSEYPTAFAAIPGCIEMHDLHSRMHTGIGAARGHYCGWMISYKRQRFL